MGILSATGTNNGFTNWWDQHRNAIIGLGTGFANGQTPSQGFGNAATGLAQGARADDAYATQQKAEAERAAAITATQKALAKYPDLQALAVPGADMGPIISELFRRSTPGYGASAQPDPFTLSPGQTRYGADGSVLASVPGASSSSPAPSGYQWGQNGQLAFIPGGPADPANKRGGGMPSPTLQKEIFETDEGVQAGQNVLQSLDRALELNDKTRSGFGADFGASVGANLPDWVPGLGGNEAVDTATLELKNIVTANALESLKATFGAAPTEGERKILLEIQGSIDQPKEVRAAIFKRARRAAERRLQFNQNKAAGLRSGQYFDEGYDAGNGGGNTTSTGVNWSVSQ